MTTPQFDIADIVPLKYKPFVGLIGSGLTFVIPTIVSTSTSLPAPWPYVIAGVVAVLTALGIYQTPGRPAGTVIVPQAVADAGKAAVQANTVPGIPPQAVTGDFQNPWQ